MASAPWFRYRSLSPSSPALIFFPTHRCIPLFRNSAARCRRRPCPPVRRRKVSKFPESLSPYLFHSAPPTHQKEFDFFLSLYSLFPLPLGAGYSPLCVLRHHQQTPPPTIPKQKPSQWLLRLYVHEPLCCKGSRSLVLPSSLLTPPLPRISWTQIS